MTNKFRLEKTSNGCPEEYSVYLNGKYVGFLYLRYGTFSVGNAKGYTILETKVIDDGVFSPEQRKFYLNLGCISLFHSLENTPDDDLYEITDRTGYREP
jgi:hypothetical protein